MFSKICLLALVAVAAAQHKGFTKPLEGFGVESCTEPGIKIVDNENLCWYHECIRTSEKTYELEARQCPVGTRVRYTFDISSRNPCTHNYVGKSPFFECSREAQSRPNPQKPFCAHNTKCHHGGTLRVQDDFCWCECLPEWSGDHDCSRRVHQDLLDNPAQPKSQCVGGSDGINHCAIAGGCLNDGECVNQCGGFHCFCKSPYRNGKRCEIFTCDKDNECFNNGTCYRGEANRDEARTCFCLPGYTGYRCETKIDDEP